MEETLRLQAAGPLGREKELEVLFQRLEQVKECALGNRQ